MTVSSTLIDIRNKVRRLTGTPSATQLSDQTINRYINDFYFYDLPEHMKTFNLLTKYQLFTTPNIEVYQFPRNTYESLLGPMYIAGYESWISQSVTELYRQYPAINTIETDLIVGNGTASPYTFKTSAAPFLRGYHFPADNTLISQVIVTTTDGLGNDLIAADDGNGGFVDQNGSPIVSVPPSTVNYLTGAITVKFSGGSPPAGAEIDVQYIFYTPNRPTMACLYGDLIFLRPIPDKVYSIEFDAYVLPTTLAADNNSPDLNTWWELLATGGARKILQDRLDVDGLQRIEPLFQERMNLGIRRTLKQQAKERASTIYTEQSQWSQFGLNGGYGSG
jgi:hypothetical protein